MAGATNVSYVPTTPAEIAADKAYRRTALLKNRLIGAAPPSSGMEGATGEEVSAWFAAQKGLSGKTDAQLQAMWRNRALERAGSQPADVADIALRDAQTGLVTRARRGSRRESMMFGDFNAMPPMGGSSLLGG